MRKLIRHKSVWVRRPAIVILAPVAVMWAIAEELASGYNRLCETFCELWKNVRNAW